MKQCETCGGWVKETNQCLVCEGRGVVVDDATVPTDAAERAARYWYRDVGGDFPKASKALAAIIRRHVGEAMREKDAEIERLRELLKEVACVLHDAPELNPSNYTHDQACKLNADATEAYMLVKEFVPKTDSQEDEA